jgi:hypothetical protein
MLARDVFMHRINPRLALTLTALWSACEGNVPCMERGDICLRLSECEDQISGHNPRPYSLSSGMYLISEFAATGYNCDSVLAPGAWSGKSMVFREQSGIVSIEPINNYDIGQGRRQDWPRCNTISFANFGVPYQTAECYLMLDLYTDIGLNGDNRGRGVITEHVKGYSGKCLNINPSCVSQYYFQIE